MQTTPRSPAGRDVLTPPRGQHHVDDPQHAGPSRLPYARLAAGQDDDLTAIDGNTTLTRSTRRIRPIPFRAKQRLLLRQDEPSTALSTSPPLFPGPSSTYPAESTPLSSFTDVTPTPAYTTANATETSFQTNPYNTTSSTYLPDTSSTTTTTPAPSSSTFSRPWQPSTKATSSHTPEETPYVPGVVLPLTLGGDDDDQAVYSVHMDFGHGTLDGGSMNRKRQKRMVDRWRRGQAAWDGGSPQTVNLQVDLGSSDLWVASTGCTSTDCKGAPSLFNASLSLDADTSMNFRYHTGEVSGDIMWEQVLLGGFGIGYQVFLAADTVTDEDLTGGNFTGVLGLALPANSVISTEIPGSTSGDPDGATFLDNLFGAGASAPTQRLFSLSLARREDVRTSSTLGIGAVSTSYCPQDTCKPNYLPIVSQPSLGVTGYLHWRVPLQSISATTWSNAEAGTGAKTTSIPLGPSQVDTGSSTPLAVLDSGGVAILVGYQQWVNAIYGAYGVSASSDGLYRLPCTTQIALTFNIGGEDYPVHPLDMSWPDPTDPSQQTCIGAIQYSSSLAKTGDFILGSSFLKNVYSIFQYPDNVGRGTWQPTVGLLSLTNASVASQDFYAVRVQRQSLSDVSSDHQSGVGVSNPASTDTGSQSNANTLENAKVLTSAMIAGISVAALFVFAAGVFCAWWFWIRRRLGKDGTMAFPDNDRRLGPAHRAVGSATSLRSKKHERAQRQKSMIEGYGGEEYEDSWLSTTEGGDSIRLGFIPEELEHEDGATRVLGDDTSVKSSMRDKSPARGDGFAPVAMDEDDMFGDDPKTSSSSAWPAAAALGAQGRRGSSASGRRPSTMLSTGDDVDVPPRYPSAYAYPPGPAAPSAGSNATSSNWNMSGPFPSPAGNRTSSARLDNSPMYDIRSSDYFDITPAEGPNPTGGVGGTARRGRDSRRTSAGGARDRSSGLGRGVSPGRLETGNGWAGGRVLEEPEDASR